MTKAESYLWLNTAQNQNKRKEYDMAPVQERRQRPLLFGSAIGVTASGCSSLQTPRAKTQTSAIYAFGLPAIVITHDATQTADYSGGDTNETMQSNK